MSNRQTADDGAALRTHAAKGSAITLVSQVLRVIIMLVSTVVLAHLIAPRDYGLLAMVVAITGVAEIFRDFGLSMAALQARELSHEQQSNLFWINAGIGLLFAAVLYLMAAPISAFYHEDTLIRVVQIVSSVYFIDGVTTQFKISINRALRFGALACCEVLPPLIAFLTAYVLARGGHGVAALVVQQVLTSLATLVVAVALAGWWPGLPSRGHNMRPLLSFGMRFAATQLLTYGTRSVDRIAIGNVWGPKAVGLYDRAFQLAIAPLNQINTPMSRVAIPVLVRIVDDRPHYISSLRKAQLIACYVTASGLFFVAGLSDPMVRLFLGPDWGAAGPILGFLCIGGVFRSIQQVSFWMFMAQGRADAQLRLHTVGQPMVIICLLAGLPWGPTGVAIGSAIGYGLLWALALLWVGRVSQIDVRPLMADAIRTILVVGAPIGLAGFLISRLVPVGAYLQIILGFAASAVWFGLCWVVSRTVRYDVEILLRFARLSVGGR